MAGTNITTTLLISNLLYYTTKNPEIHQKAIDEITEKCLDGDI